jgi:glycosyltransferase involved in cell wall biosynthesis
MRRILFAAGFGFHSLFNSILEYPPQGYEFIFPEKPTGKKPQLSKKIRNAVPLKNNSLRGLLLSQLSWYTGDLFRKTSIEADLIFSANRLIYSKKKPWVVMIEHIGDLCPIMYDIKHLGFYRFFIEKVLSSEWCKKIMPYLDTERMTLFKSLNCEGFKDKIEVVNLAVPPKIFEKEYGKDKISLLFLGTAHKGNIPKSFEERGGLEVLEAFKVLNARYENLELVVRSHVPPYIRNKYSQVLAGKNVKVFEQVLSMEERDHIMQNADIFVFPGHITPALTLLDVMSYEIPVVATNWRGNYEMVKDGETGFLIRPPFGLNPDVLTREITDMVSARSPDMHVAKELVEKTSILIEDEKLRRKMGIAGRREIETGKFSIKRRNEKLKKIFDEAIGF